MAAIKLIEIQEYPKGVRRFTSQLNIGKNVADFIMEDSVMKCWDRGDKGFDFYPYKGEYEIVSDIKDMLNQII